MYAERCVQACGRQMQKIESAIRLSSSHLVPEFLVWNSRSSLSLSLFYTVCCCYGFSRLLSPPGLSWSGLTDRNVLQLAFWSSSFWCQGGVCSFVYGGRFQFLQYTVVRISCRYTRFLVLQLISALMLYCLPVVLFLNLLHVIISLQHLHQLLLHLVFMALVRGAGGFCFAQKSKPLIFLGRLKGIIGGSGMAFFSLLEVWRIWRCFLAILDRLVRPGWYVTISGVHLVGCLCLWDSGPPCEAALILYESVNLLLLSGGLQPVDVFSVLWFSSHGILLLSRFFGI